MSPLMQAAQVSSAWQTSTASGHAVAMPPQRVTAGGVGGGFLGDEALDAFLQQPGAAPQPLHVPREEIGMLERGAVDFLLQALGRAMGEA